METLTAPLTHVDNLWDEALAATLDPVERLVYRSNLLGQSPRITNTGGGNTSSKVEMPDPVTGEPVSVLWVKGSGGDLRTATRANFASLYQDKVLSLQRVYGQTPERGPKTPAEDAMVAMYPHTTFALNPRAPSIDTPLHAFVPYAHVDHTHPVAVIALATAADGPALTREVYGDRVVWTDWQRPGFELGLTLQRICRDHPDAVGVLMGGHGLINWADDDRDCYRLSLELIDQAERFLAERDQGGDAFGGGRHPALPVAKRQDLLADLLPWLRGKVSGERRFVGTVETGDDVLAFVNARDACRLAELGTSCPDHFLRTKIKPLHVDWDPHTGDLGGLKDALEAGLEQYRDDYAAYYHAHKRPDSPAIRIPNPTVILIPGLGMVAWGKTKSESRVTAEFYKAAIGVMRGAESISTYTALPRQEAFDIEYWALEEAKLQRMPPEKELARQIAVVVGGGSGIGRATVRRLLGEGAVVAVLDLRAETAQETARELLAEVGMGIGVAGTDGSGCGDVIGLACDATSRDSIRAALRQVVLAYGGVDHVAVTAGYFAPDGTDGQDSDQTWAPSFAVNVTAPYFVADEVRAVWEAQGLTGSLVITTSANAVVSKTGSYAYDVSKAAANHLVRELAVSLAPRVRVNGVAPATVVDNSSMFPRERVIGSLAKYGLPHDDAEDTSALRQRLAAFYAQRSLMDQPITTDDQAEAIFLLISDRRLPKTTGQVIAVDGGLKDAFLR